METRKCSWRNNHIMHTVYHGISMGYVWLNNAIYPQDLTQGQKSSQAPYHSRLFAHSQIDTSNLLYGTPILNLTPLLLNHPPQPLQVQRHRLPHPRSPLTMIPNLIVRIRMNQRRQRASIYHQPGNESAELLCQLTQYTSHTRCSCRYICTYLD